MHLLRLLLSRLAALAAAIAVPAASLAAAPVCPPPPLPLTPERAEAGMKAAKDHGFFWRLSKDGRSSYLYGTIHAARPDWMFPGPTVVEAIAASDIVALELDVLDPDVQRRLVASIGGRRGDVLPPALQRRLEKRMAIECVEAATFSRLSPEFQIASLSVLAARADGIDPSYAIDLVLASLARNLDKPVFSLETPESQMQALQMPTPAETIAFVERGLADLEAGRVRPLLNRVAKIWIEGDYAELSRYERWCNCVRTAGERAAMQRLLAGRNPALAEGIDGLHASGKRVFAAVGSLHMIGPTGLPTLLRQRGYKVEQGDFTR